MLDKRLMQFRKLAHRYGLETSRFYNRLIISRSRTKELQIDLHEDIILVAYVRRYAEGYPYEWIQLYEGKSLKTAIKVYNKKSLVKLL